uniref:Spectrin beta chain, non-erythrocytic 2 n=1 Tax=Heliothis virescens TaxID=7102 RepID=A0A2A4JKU8_HELVI
MTSTEGYELIKKGVDIEVPGLEVYYDKVVIELRDERESVQKKTFQKWVNSHLVRVGCRIGDLYVDMRDGKQLIKLLEVLSGERLPRPTKGKMRIHCLENVDKALQFLREQRVHLENMGSHDIVDGNPRLSLGLIWTIILRFQIQDITIEETDNKETKSAKDALLLWCQMKTAGYNNVNVRNFTTSWRDGLAFNAIIHKHRPDLIQFDKLHRSNPMHNLNNAFNVAEEKLGLTKLLDAEDIAVDHPDEKSIITYVVTYYHYFSKMKQETVQGKRIGKVVGIAMENDKMMQEYESLTSDLLQWIERTIEALGDRTFANSLEGVRQQLIQFANYRTVEKPPKFVEKGNLEVLLFTLQSRMRAANQKPYTPREGKMIHDINRAWERLEKSEHERELALREELIRQEKLEQLAARFNRKAQMRETWLSENQRLVSQDNFGFDLAAVEAAAKKHEAIETDIFAYEERVQAVVAVCSELQGERYHDMERVSARRDNVLRLWAYLLELLRARRARLELSLQLQQNFQEMLYILDSMEEIKMRLLTDDYGKHLMGVEDLLQKHALVEADINVLGERVKVVVGQSQRFLEQEEGGYRPCDPAITVERIQQLENAYAELVHLAVERRKRLEDSRKLWQFYWDMADEENWIKEKEQIVSVDDIGHDLTTVYLLISKHKALEADVQAHEPQLMSVAAVGDELISQGHFGADRIQDRLRDILSQWNHLLDMVSLRKNRLDAAVRYHQLFADADDIDNWMLDTLRLVSSEDTGVDEAQVQSLLKKHKDVTDELKNYANVIQQLKQQAAELSPSDASSAEVVSRLGAVDARHGELAELARLRKQRLLDALSLFKLLAEADAADQWIAEKDRMLDTMLPPKDIDDVEIMKHRYDGFDKEMNANASRVAVVNQLARQLIHVEHPQAARIQERQAKLNSAWSALREKAESKKDDLKSAQGVQTFHIECRETVSWIEDKKRILQQTDNLEMDLNGVMTLQRRLSGMERDLAAIQARISSLESEASAIEGDHPEEAQLIRDRVTMITENWEQLTQMLKERDAKLEEAGDLHRFLRSVDHFQAWLTKTQTDVASEDTPSNLAEAEKLLSQHQTIKEEIDNYKDEYAKMMEYGEKITAEPSTQDDPQYMFLRERLKALREGWAELQQMWENRQQLLTQSLELQLLQRDARQAEVLLSHQEHRLAKVEPPANLEHAENMIKEHEAFLTTMEANDDKINSVVQFANRLVEERHFDADKIQRKADNIDARRNANREKALQQMEKLQDQLQLHQFLQDCDELAEWVQEKNVTAQDDTYRSAKTIHSKWTRHQAFEAEIAANKERLFAVQNAAEELMKQKPEFLKERDAKLEEAGDLHRFLRSVDHFQAWLTKTQTDVASEDTPSNLAEAEKLLSQHQTIKEEIDNYKDEYAKMMEYGEKITAEPSTQDDPQYMFLRERLKALREGWAELQQMWENRQQLLTQSLELQLLQRDARQAEVLLSHQEHRLAKVEPPANLEHAENMIKEHEAFLTTMEANDDKINSVVQFANRLVEERHFDADKIQRKADNIDARRNANREKALQQMEKLQDQLQLHQFLQDCDELAEWVQEKNVTAQDDTYRSAKTIHSKWTRHQAFEAEIAANKERLFAVQNAAEELMKQKPEFVEIISPKMSELQDQFENLQTTTKEKGERLFDANREVLLHQTCDDIDSWMNELEKQIENTDTGTDLASVNILMQKQQMIETQMAVKAKQVTELETQAEYLQKTVPDKMDEIKEKKKSVEQRFEQLKAPLLDRQRHLAKKKEAFQFRRDVEDEKLWVHEKMPLATSTDYGNSLFNVQMLQKKNQSLKTETDNHEPRILTVISNGQKLIDEGHEDTPEFKQLIDELTARWRELKDAIDERKNKLSQWEKAQQYLFDANEAEAWMSEQELYMMVEDRGKDEISAQNLMKKHEILEQAVDDYAHTIRQLGETVRHLTADEHPLSEQISVKQSQVDKLYAGLKDLAGERRAKLDEALRLFQLSREVDDLEQWITERELVASSQELGQDYDHVTLLWERFKEFARETQAVGSERVATAERIADQMIAMGHSDNATIAQWKEGLKETWQDLLELIETRTQMLAASRELHKYFHDCKDTLQRVNEKARGVSDELGRDAISVGALQRKHHNFMQDLSTLHQQVEAIRSECGRLGAMYAGEKAAEITRREDEVRGAWAALAAACQARTAKLEDADHLYRFLNQVRTLTLWMDDVVRQMNTGEKPRDVSGVELLMNNHQSLKAEIDTREDNFSACISLGRELLARQHYASADIKEKLLQLTNQRNALLRRWEERWENLQLILEVYQFARDAAVAEAWLIAQEPYLMSQELGHTIDEVESLIKKHEAFEKSAAAQEDRFSALQRLTTLEQRESSMWPSAQPWDKCDESNFTYQPPPAARSHAPLTIQINKNERPVSQIVEEIITDSNKFNLPDKIKARVLNINYANNQRKNDSYLWSVANHNSLSTISEDSVPNSPLMSPTSPEIYSSVFFEFPDQVEKANEYLACIDLILWERLSYLNVYPNVSLLRHKSNSSSKSSLKRFIRKWSKKVKPESDIKGEVAVLSLPGLTSSSKAINDLGKEVKSIPLSSSLLLLSQTRNLLFPDGAWYYNYLDSVSVVLVLHVLRLSADGMKRMFLHE